MQGLVFIVLLSFVTLVTVYVSALVGMAVAGMCSWVQALPEELWLGVLIALTILSWRGLNYSLD